MYAGDFVPVAEGGGEDAKVWVIAEGGSDLCAAFGERFEAVDDRVGEHISHQKGELADVGPDIEDGLDIEALEEVVGVPLGLVPLEVHTELVQEGLH